MLRSDHRELRNSLVQLGWVVGGMRANTETSRSSARARAATTMSIGCGKRQKGGGRVGIKIFVF